MIETYNATGTLIFRAAGGRGGGMKPEQRHTFRWDTHSNTLPAAKGAVFLLPAPVAYALRMTLREGRDKPLPDSRLVKFEVKPKE